MCQKKIYIKNPLGFLVRKGPLNRGNSPQDKPLTGSSLETENAEG